jgi:hypothetical protein
VEDSAIVGDDFSYGKGTGLVGFVVRVWGNSGSIRGIFVVAVLEEFQRLVQGL